MEDIASHERFHQEFRNDENFTWSSAIYFRETPYLAESSIVIQSRGASSPVSTLRSASPAPAALQCTGLVPMRFRRAM
jgi:hypothetical protein